MLRGFHRRMSSDRSSRLNVTVYAVSLLSFLVAAGSYFRVVYLKTISLHVDEFISLLAVKSILLRGYPLLPSGTLYEQGLLFSYIEAVVLKCLGFGLSAGRLSSLVLSVATIVVLYWVGKRLFSRPVGLMAATFGALSAQSIAWGGRVRMYVLLQVLVLLAVWFLWRGAIEEDNARYRWLSIVCYLGALFTHPVSVLILPPLVLSLFVNRGVRALLRPSYVAQLVVAVAGILATLLLKMMGQPGQLEALGETRPYLAPSFDVMSGLRPIAPFFLSWDRLPLTFLAVAALIILIAVCVSSARRGKSIAAVRTDLPALLFLCALFGTTVLEMVFLVGPTWRDTRYLFMVAPFFFLISSWAAVFGVAWIRRRVQRKGATWIWAISDRERLSWPLTSLLVGGAFLLLLPGACSTISRQEWGYDLAFDYLQQRWREGDTVLTIVPFACELYLPQCDYYASGTAYEEYVFERDGVLVDRWVGAPLLNSASQLDAVLRDSSRTWFVVDGWRLAARYDLDFVRTVVEQMDVAYEAQGVRVLLADGYQPLAEPETSKAAQVNFGDRIQLVGYELSHDSLDPDDDLRVTLYWEALNSLDEEYTVFLHLRGRDGALAAQSDSPPLENLYPTYYWAPGEPVPDPRVLSVPAEVGPGIYRLEVGLYRSQDQRRLAVMGEQGSPGMDFAVLDYVRIGEEGELASAAYPVGANLGDQVVLVGHEGIPDAVQAGQVIHLTLYWEALSQMDEDYTVFVHLVDGEGSPIAQSDSQPLSGFYPTSFWEVGELVGDEHHLRVDTATPVGEYELVAGMYLLGTGERLSVLNEDHQAVADFVSLGAAVVKKR